jgi:hypothetical protein
MNMNKMNILLAITISITMSAVTIKAAQQKSKTDEDVVASSASSAPAAAVNQAGQQSGVRIESALVQAQTSKGKETKEDVVLLSQQEINDKMNEIMSCIYYPNRDNTKIFDLLKSMNEKHLEQLFAIGIFTDDCSEYQGGVLRSAVRAADISVIKFIINKYPQTIQQDRLILEKFKKERYNSNFQIGYFPLIFEAFKQDIHRNKKPYRTCLLLEVDPSIINDSVKLSDGTTAFMDFAKSSCAKDNMPALYKELLEHKKKYEAEDTPKQKCRCKLPCVIL